MINSISYILFMFSAVMLFVLGIVTDNELERWTALIMILILSAEERIKNNK